MAFQPPTNILKAGERPARVRTGARTATKTQERDMLEKLRGLAEDPAVLVPEWLGPGRSPFEKLSRKLARIQRRRDRERALRWSARGKRLWNGYAASLLVLRAQKIPSFAAIKFQGREVKFAYRRGTGRQALIGVQHFDDPQVRLIGYTSDARRKRVYVLSSPGRLYSQPPRARAPVEALAALFSDHDVEMRAADDSVRCPHAEGTRWRYRFSIPDLGWNIELCMDCLGAIGDNLESFLEQRVLGPRGKIPIERELLGHAFELRPDASAAAYAPLARSAFEAARSDAKQKYVSYSDAELAQWTKERLLRQLEARPGGFLLVGDELWLTGFEEAADAYVHSDLERRAIKAAFGLRPPRVRSSDQSLTKILEPYWRDHAGTILSQLSDGALKPQELSQIERLNPSEALASLARILGARERFREFLQFEELPPALDFVVQCLQFQRSGEGRVLSERLQAASRDAAMRTLALALARSLGEQTTIEWQYAPHEKDAASFLEPYLREVVSAPPAKFGDALTQLASVVGVPAPRRKAA